MVDGPIYWHQGLFLQPQHFQRTDQRTEQLLGQLAGLSRSWLWGVRALTWDLGALKAGCLKPQTLQMLLPGMGLELSCPGNAVCPGRMVPESLAAGSSIDVYFGLAPFREGEGNVSQGGESADYERMGTRLCLSEGMDDVPDLYGDGPSARMQRLNYVLQILLGPERDTAGDVLCLRVARMRRTADGLVLDTDYAPACISLQDSLPLLDCFREIRDRVLAKIRELDSYKELARRSSMGDMTGIFLMLRSLARFAPRLELGVDMPLLAPWEAYLLLRDLLAELSVFSLQTNPLGEDRTGQSILVPYRHDDPLPAFRSLRSAISAILDSLATGPRYVIRFERGDLFDTAAIPPHVLEAPGCQYWVSLFSQIMPLSEGDPGLTRLKFSPRNEMNTLLTRALPGLPFSLEEHTPMGLARKQGTIYARLHADAALWQKVREQGGLALSWEEAPADLEACFIVLEG